MDNATVEPVFAESALEPDLLADDDQAVGADGHVVPRIDRYAAWSRRSTPPAGFVGSAVALIDLLLVVASAALASVLYVHFSDSTLSGSPHYAATALIGAVILVALLERLGGYQLKRLQSLNWQVPHIMLVWSIGMASLLLAAFVGKISGDYSRGWALLWFLATPLILIAARATELTALRRQLNDGSLARRVAIVGAGDDGERLVAALTRCADKSFAIRGIFDDRRARRPSHVHGIPVIGTTNDLLRLSRCERIDEVVVALPITAEDRLKAIFEKLTVIPADLRLSINAVTGQLPIRGIGYFSDVPMLDIVHAPLRHARSLCKWLEDKLLALLILALVGPLMAVIAILIKLDSRGPVFFAQERYGFSNNVIRVLKYRTMYHDSCDPSGAQRTVRNDPRVTRVGRILRSLSLDELPQLINVLIGDMSVVGPRPHAVGMKAGDRPYHLVVAQYPHRHRVKPGITGWAQVNGCRGEVSTLEKAHRRVEFDLHYIERWSLWLDFKILLMTTKILLLRTDAY
jgi:Undecaprenyl-phosphate glucose phosphotransferase